MLSLLGVLGFVWSVISNPAILLVAALVVAGLTLLWFVGGPLTFWRVLRDARLWLAVAAACAVFGYANLSKDLAATQKKLDQQQSQAQSHSDGQEVEKNRAKKQAARAQETSRLQKAIDDAPEGQEVDYLLDQIAREQGQAGAAPGARDDQPQSGGVRDDAGSILP